MKYCQKCGSENPAEAIYCIKCGLGFHRPIEAQVISSILSRLSPFTFVLVGCILLAASLFLPWETRIEPKTPREKEMIRRFMTPHEYYSRQMSTGLELPDGTVVLTITISVIFLALYNNKFNRSLGLPYLVFAGLFSFSFSLRYMWAFWSAGSLTGAFASLIAGVGIYKLVTGRHNLPTVQHLETKANKPRSILFIGILQVIVVLLSPLAIILELSKGQYWSWLLKQLDPLYPIRALGGVGYIPILLFSAAATISFIRSKYWARFCIIGFNFLYIYGVLATVFGYSLLAGKLYLPNWVQVFVLLYSCGALYFLYRPRVIEYFNSQIYIRE